jgi:hypothetical protein
MEMSLAVWRDISLLWLIFLALIAVLPFGVIFYFLIRGMRRLRQLALLYLPLAQDKVRLVADKTNEISLKVTEPVINAQAKAAQVDGMRKAIFTRRQDPWTSDKKA